MNQRLREDILKEQMLIDSVIILASVEFIQNRIEEKLLEIDTLGDDYTFEESALIRTQVLELLSKLRREEKAMDEFMARYKRLLNEKKAMLPRPIKGKPIYLRGVPTYIRRQEAGN